MSDHLSRITLRKATFSGSFDDLLILTGYVMAWEPVAPVKRDVLRPVEPDEPDTDVEVGYSRNALEPLVIEFRGKKVKLTDSTYPLFRYVNDLNRAEGQEEFEFAELSEVLTGTEGGKSNAAIGKLVRRIAKALAKIAAPIVLSYNREVLYVAMNDT